MLFLTSMMFGITANAQIPGETCDDPLVITSLPFTDAGNTSTYGDNYSSSNVPPLAPGAITNGSSSLYLNGDDVVYAYTPTSNEIITISLTGVGSWTGLFAFTGCPFASTVGSHTSSATGTRLIPDMPVVGGTTYYFVISTYASPQSTAYNIEVTKLIDCSGAPVAGNITGPSTICAESPITITADNPVVEGGISYQWQSSPAGANTWTDITGATSADYSSSTGISVATDFRMIITCAASNLSDTSNVISMTLLPPLECYCEPIYSIGCGNGARVNGVTTTLGITNITNTGTGCNQLDATGYTDYTASHSVSAAHASPMDVQVDVSNYSGGVKIWIDWNQDGIFDASELVGESSTTIAANQSYLANFDVPTTAIVGPTRMRVRVVESSTTFTPCSSQSYGEAEDYEFVVIQGTPCSGMPNIDVVNGPDEVCASVDFSLSMDPILETEITYLWQSSPAGADTWTDIAGATQSVYNATGGITSETDYRLIVTCTNSSMSDTTDVHEITILPASGCYCIPEATASARYIDNFATTGGVQNITNNSTGFSTGGYGDFTNMVVQQDVFETIDFTATVVGGTAGFRIWVDWNQNGIFENDEVVFNTTSYTASPSGSFDVPATALEGETRMRIVSHYLNSSANITPCETGYIYGEFEDYTIQVSGFPDCDTTTTPSAWSIVLSEDTFCMESDIHLSVNETIFATDVTYLFQQSTDGTTWTDIGTPSTTPEANVTGVNEDTHFRVIWLCDDNGVDTSTATVHVIIPEITSTTDAAHCGPGTVTLSAEASMGDVRWYDDNLGTTLLATGDDFVTPNLTSSTTYWAAAGTGGGLVDSLHTIDVAGNLCGGGAMFDLTPSIDMNLDSLMALAGGSGSEVKIYYREGGHVGYTTTESAWTLHETVSMSYSSGKIMIPLTEPLELNANTTYGIFVNYSASYTNGTATNATHSNADLLFEGGYGVCTAFSSVNANRIFNGAFYYSEPGCQGNFVAVEAFIGEDTVTVDLGEDLVVCEGETLTLDAGDQYDTYLWSDNSTDQTLEVTAAGTYEVEVSINGCLAVDEVEVTVIDPASGDEIDVTLTGSVYQFSVLNPMNVDSYLWDFGDGNSSTDENPTHEYDNPGTYEVSVIINRDDCNDGTLLEKTLEVTVNIDEVVKSDRYIKLYPNPANNVVTIELEEELQMHTLMVQDITGRIVLEQTFVETTSNVRLSTQSLASGLYQVVIDTNEGRFVRKLEIIK